MGFSYNALIKGLCSLISSVSRDEAKAGIITGATDKQVQEFVGNVTESIDETEEEEECDCDSCRSQTDDCFVEGDCSGNCESCDSYNETECDECYVSAANRRTATQLIADQLLENAQCFAKNTNVALGQYTHADYIVTLLSALGAGGEATRQDLLDELSNLEGKNVVRSDVFDSSKGYISSGDYAAPAFTVGYIINRTPLFYRPERGVYALNENGVARFNKLIK